MPRSLAAGLVFFLLLLQGCSHFAVQPDRPVRDVLTFPQSPAAYVSEGCADKPVFSAPVQQKAAKKYLEAMFSPWARSASGYEPDNLFWGVKAFSGKPAWGENLSPRPSNWMAGLIDLSDMDDFPNANYRGITTRTVSLRVMPTNKPHFHDPEKPGEGYPFDNFQNSVVWAGTPVRVCQISADRQWVLAETSFAFGWVRAMDIAVVGDEFARAFATGKYVAITRENLPIADGLGQVRFMGRVGMVLPVASENEHGFEVLIPGADIFNRAQILVARVDKDDAGGFPVLPTQKNFAFVADQFMGQLYGWAGMYENRDCSSMTRDLVAPFGVWLPRNSSRQARVGRVFDLSEMKPEQKEKFILEHGDPWQTLVYRKGHILLYIGKFRGRAAVMHAVWGLKTNDFGKEGRHVIGKVVITGLEPGKELPDLDRDKGNLLNLVRSMNILTGD